MEDKDLQFVEQTTEKPPVSFMSETIKEKPVNKKKLFRRTIITAFSALVFGAVACFTFLVLEPVVSNWLYPEEITKVEFPEEEEEILPEEMLTENVLQEELQADIREQVEELASQESETTLTVESYEQIYQSLKNIAVAASNFMVTVKGTVSEVDWLQDTNEIENVVSGVIIADNGVEFLILADITGLEDSETYSVTFANNKVAEAVLKEKHTPTGIGVFGVEHDKLSKVDMAGIEIAVLGNSSITGQIGKPVIAIGRPLGQNNSLLYGMISAKSTALNSVDSVYQVIDTDMNSCANSSGVIINLDKEVIGIITNSALNNKNHPFISAMGISDLKQLIEKLSNGEKIPYLGIKGMDVSTEAHEELNVPYGAYVSEVEMQSPAMEAGILNGDIIIQVEEEVIDTFFEYKNVLMNYRPDDLITLKLLRFTGSEYTEMEVVIQVGECR